MIPTKVQLITDQDDVRKMVESVVCRTDGCQLICGRNGRLAPGIAIGEEVSLCLAHVPHRDIALARQCIDEITEGASRIPVIVLCDHDDPEFRLELLRHGAIDCLPRPLDLSRLAFLIDMLTLRARYQPDASFSKRQLEAADEIQQLGDFLVRGPAMRQMCSQIRTVAPLDTTILLEGETGTGKTHLARVVHGLSPRKDRPFLAVNCGALTPTLLESELFGHVRGAFTHADRDRIGKLAEVGKGTLFLDEVDSVPLESQVKLLRAVEERVFEPVGSNKSQHFQARLIAASNRNLEKETAAGRFRADLYYRLNVVSFYLPPLRSRPELIRSLVQRFLQESRDRAGDSRRALVVSPEALEALEAYQWPGNIRELRNAMERCVALCQGAAIQLADLPEVIQHAHAPAQTPANGGGNHLAEARMTAEARSIVDALTRHGNNRTSAAADLGISRVTLYKKLRRYGIA